MSFSFHSEQTDFRLNQADRTTEWLINVCREEGKEPQNICYIFCNDEYLLDINRKYLQHDHYTDIITFDYCENNRVSGDLFVSIDRVSENARDLGVTMQDELHRVMVHGLLHLLGYDDKTTSDKEQMTAKEDFYLSLRFPR